MKTKKDETTVNLAGWLEKLTRIFYTYIYYKKLNTTVT